MVTHLFNVFGMALAFALTAKKWGIQYIIAAFYVETNSVSALTCCTAWRVNDQAIPRIPVALYHLTSRCISSLESLEANRGVMLQNSLFYVCYRRTILVIELSLLSIVFFLLLLLSFMIRISFYFCYLLYITIMQVSFIFMNKPSCIYHKRSLTNDCCIT